MGKMMKTPYLFMNNDEFLLDAVIMCTSIQWLLGGTDEKTN
jgi:hypothetical protein